MRKNREELNDNETQITLVMFLESYNKNIPVGFPRASITALKKFQDTHPTLFRKKDMWSIARHRKRLMDWLSSGPDIS